MVEQAPALRAQRSTLPADQQPAAVYLARLAPGSRRTMEDALETMAALISSGNATAGTLPWSRLRYQHTQAIRAQLAATYKPATVNKHLSALRGVLKEAWRLGQMSAEDLARASDLASVRGETIPSGRALSGGEVRSLFETCRERRPADLRDAALMAVLYGCGLRRAEVVALNMSDYEMESGALTVRAGKGRKARIVYATNGVSAALEAWTAERGGQRGPMFVPVTKGGTLAVRRMTTQAVYEALQRRADRAGIKHFSPHDMRRTMISDLLDAGADVVAVQHLAGHSNVSTTARYDRRGERAKRRAAEMLHVPVPF